MNEAPIYLDYNATTPCDPRVVEAMLPYFTQHFGNAASRDHGYGWVASDAVESAREQVARLINTSPKHIVFTSGATESINLAIKGMVDAHPNERKHLVTSKAEHKAVLDTCNYLESKGVSVTYLDVDNNGSLSLDALEAAIVDHTVAVVLMYANNETGVINPVREIAEITKRKGVCFICDATQAVGKISVDVGREGVDLLVFSAHKLYGPKGVGALFMRGGITKEMVWPQHHGGNHERGTRSGTLNVPGIVGFGKAAELCGAEMQRGEASRLCALRDKLESSLLATFEGASVNGGGPRLPHVSNLLFPGVDSEQLLLAVSRHLAISRGSACSGIVQQPSHVLKSMGLDGRDARNAIRISLGRFTTPEAVTRAQSILTDKVKQLQIKGQMVYE